jgi:chitinase
MKHRLFCMIIFVFCVSGLVSAVSASRETATFCAYFVEWGVYARDYFVADIPADKLTHIKYAFIEPADITGDGYFECRLFDTWAALEKPMDRLVPGTNPDQDEHRGNLNQFTVLRRNHPDLTVLMSLGGWTLSYNFPVIASTEAHRTHFAEFCVQFMHEHGFDGIDIDWEYPGPGDRDNFTLLLQTFRTVLDDLSDTTGIHYPLTIAAPAGPAHIMNIDLPAIEPYLDFINLMTYDFNGIWSSTTAYNSPLYTSPDDPMGPTWNSDAAVQTYLIDIPPEKLNLGMAYYGRGFQNLHNSGPNPGYPGRYAGVTAGSPVQGTWDDTGVFDYWDIVNRFSGTFQHSVDPLPVLDGYTRYWDAEQIAAYVFHPDAVGQTGFYWLGYDDPQSLTAKVQYARSLNLGGVVIWELSQESSPGVLLYPLTDAIHAALTPEQCLNHGDVNFDGNLTAYDAQMAFMIALGLHTPTFEEECAADCNGDGVVTAGDAQLIFYSALGMDECVDEA